MKKEIYIYSGISLLLIILFFRYRKRLIANRNFMGDQITGDKELNEVVKRIYKLETANYTSNIFNQTNGAGTIAFSDSYPYGWSMLKDFWDNDPEFAPVGIYNSSNGFGYLVFPSILAGQKAVAEIVKKRVSQGLTAGAYNSLDSEEAANYLKKLLTLSLPDGDKIRPNKYLKV